jgi:integrase
MAKRRQNGEGTISQRPGGTWQARLSYVDPVTGLRKRTSVDAPTAAAVRTKMKEVRERLEAGAPPKDATQTVASWLTHWRATTLAASDRKESTRELYASLSKSHLESGPFGALTLDKLRASDIDALIVAMRSKTKPGKPTADGDTEPEPVRALSDSTIRSTYVVLRAALDGAVRDGLLAKNPAAAVDRPGVERREAKHLAAAGVSAVLKAAEASRYHPALVLIAATGLRKGECLALRWDQVDLNAATIKIAATIARINGKLVITEPKTERSRRVVPLSATVVAVLRKRKAAQAAERLAAGDQWTNPDNLVFTTETGGNVDPRNLLRVIEVAAKAAKIDGVGIHTLRHSAATAWLDSGVHIRQVADLLGHSSISVTGDIYGHGSDDGARRAVDTLAQSLGL